MQSVNISDSEKINLALTEMMYMESRIHLIYVFALQVKSNLSPNSYFCIYISLYNIINVSKVPRKKAKWLTTEHNFSLLKEEDDK